MSLDGQFDREAEHLQEQYASGEISRDQYNEAMRDLQRDAAEAERAHQEEMRDAYGPG